MLGAFKKWLGVDRTAFLPDREKRPEIIIELRQVIKTYKTPAGDFTALKNVDLQVRPGEFVAVIGKSGSGKSTLINMVTGIDRPTLGQVIVAGQPIHSLNENDMAIWRGYNLGVIFQFFQLLPTLTLIENVMLPMEVCHTYSLAERQERALYLLELVEMVDQADKFPAAISGGQQQRVAIARALANDPYILIADEPTGSLDTKTSDAIYNIFEKFVQQGGTILMVTHDRDLASRVSRVVLIADGEITDQYVTQALPDLSSTELVKLSARLEPAQYSPGADIIRQGDIADKFYIIVRGEVDVIVEYPTGETAVVDHLGTGQYFGEIGILEHDRRTATVRAVGDIDVMVMELDRDTFINLMEQSQLTNREVARLLSRREDELREQAIQMLLPQLDQELLHKIEAESEILTFAAGEVIIRQGEPADRFYIVQQGEVEVIRQTVSGEERLLSRLQAGDYFGEMGLLRGGKRNATVRAASDTAQPVQVAAMSQAAFNALTESEIKLSPHETAHLMRHQLAEKLKDFMPDLRKRGHAGGILSTLEFDDEE